MRTPEALAHPIDILIAEDDAPLRSSLRLLLEQHGYTCAEAKNGQEALTLARHSPPRCLLLDLAMPELDGFAVARQLRSDPRTRDIHIHCLSGRADPTCREQARQAGCEKFLTKPVDVATLVQLVHQEVRRPATECITGLSKTQAEELLDWLEIHGPAGGTLSYHEGQGFTVEYPLS